MTSIASASVRQELSCAIGCANGAADPTEIVLVPPGGTLARGFAQARLLAARGPVRLIADGATLRGVWPEWVHSARGLVLTEIYAYRVADPVAATADARASIRSWLDRVFAGCFQTLRGSEVFYGVATRRFLQPYLRGPLLIDGLLARHPRASWHVTDPQWEPLLEFRRRAELLGGRVSPAERRAFGWRLQVAALGALALPAAMVDHLVSVVKARPSVRRLRELRVLSRGRSAAGKLWVVLTPDWPRINSHVLESVVRPALARGERPGVLLFATLHPGLRSELHMRKHTPSPLWPALGPLRESMAAGPIDQVVGPESLWSGLGLALRVVPHSVRALGRLVAEGPRVTRGPFPLDLSAHAIPIVKIATQELMRARAAEAATSSACRRHDFSGATVVLAGSSFPAESVFDRLLQQHGARTVDFVHGSTGVEWFGLLESPSSTRVVWTYADAEDNERLGRATIVGGAPRSVIERRRDARASKILILSNYVHRDSITPAGFPLEPFQDELLDLVPLVRRRFAGRFTVRWRPHPADNERAVSRTHERHPEVELSRGRSLAGDVDWSDIIVSTFSSATVEALMSGAPVLLHAIPFVEQAVAATGFVPERCFFHAAELLPRLEELVRKLDRGDPTAIEPERRLRVRLFGPSGEPSPFPFPLAD